MAAKSKIKYTHNKEEVRVEKPIGADSDDVLVHEEIYVPVTKVGKSRNLNSSLSGGQIVSRVLKGAAILVVLFIIICLFCFTANSGENGKFWDEQATIGNTKAKNHYVMYTDLVCPFCDAFTVPLLDHKEEFLANYAEAKDIVFELRVTDFLYEYGAHKTEYSRQSAEAVACAQKEGKFWDYYSAAVHKINQDFYSKGIGVSMTSEQITTIDDNYWLSIGESVGLGDSFKDCYNNHEQLETVIKNTAEALKDMRKLGASGVPLFKFNKFVTTGFELNGGWGYVQQYLDAGLQKK